MGYRPQLFLNYKALRPTSLYADLVKIIKKTSKGIKINQTVMNYI